MNTVVIECVIGSAPVISGTEETVSGLVAGSSVITCDAFSDKRVTVKRNGSRLPRIDTGGQYYSKDQINNFISLNEALVNGEIIYIETIPK